jgi:hypothetical protein
VLAIEHEAAYRTMLRRGLERPPGESVEREEEEEAGSIRAGRRVRWLRNALAPARERMDEGSFERLVAAMCLCVGIESLVVVRDVYDLEAQEAEEVARWAAFALLRVSVSESPDGERREESDQRPEERPPDPPYDPCAAAGHDASVQLTSSTYALRLPS